MAKQPTDDPSKVDLTGPLYKMQEAVELLRAEVNYLRERVSEQETQITMLINECHKMIKKEL
jgi:predicted RNase H-like nuclease (RuvC/YqgF family)